MKPLWMVAAACAVWASGCSKSESESAPAAPNAPAATKPNAARQASASAYARVDIATNAGLFWFQPRRCSVGQDADSGVMAYSIEGPGQTPDGQPIYVTVADEDGSEAHGPELRINVGTDQPRKTPELVWIANDGTANHLRTARAKATVEGETVTMQGVIFGNGGDERLTVQTPIRMDCTQR